MYRAATRALFCVATCQSIAAAQFLPTPADNASLPPRGSVRVSITTMWQRYDSRSGLTATTSGRREDLGAAYSFPVLGAEQLLRLANSEQTIASLSGISTFDLSLGTTSLRAEVRETVTPFEADMGVTPWFSFGVSVPLVRASGETVLEVNPSGTEGNVGINPGIAFPAASTANTQVRNQFTAAATSLESRLAGCITTPTGPGCAALLARQTEAQLLITESRAFRNSVETLFGSDTVTASQFVPIENSAAHLGINTRIASFNTRFRDLLALGTTDPDPVLARPFPAQTSITASDLRAFLEQSDLGYGLLPLLSFQREGIGDIELRARVRLLDTFGPDTATAPGMRASLNIVGRLATGVAADPSVAFDVGTGDGQNDVEVGGALDLRLSRALSLSAMARMGVQMPDKQLMRIASPGTAFAESFTLREVDRDLGDYFDFSVRPRLRFSRYASLQGAFYLHSKTSDHYTGTFVASDAETGRGSVTLNASVLDEGTAVSIQRAGIGLRVANYENPDQPTNAPIEFVVMYLTQLGSTGFGVPDASVLTLQLRVQTRLFGRPPQVR